jgi:hypothetical protein
MPTTSNNTTISNKNMTTVADFYQYLDDLFELDESDSDTLFASGYMRGFLSLVATEFGDENQLISTDLIKAVTQKAMQAKAELSPQDYAIVSNFWLDIQKRVVL